MKQNLYHSGLFTIAALYDGLLGLAFILSGEKLFAWFNVTPPNHYGYIYFPAWLLVIFAVMFIQIAQDPVKYRHLITYGIFLKMAYCGVVGYYWFTVNLPDMWKPFWVFDGVFLVLFIISAYHLKPSTNAN